MKEPVPEPQEALEAQASKIRIVYARPAGLNLVPVELYAVSHKNLKTTAVELISEHQSLICTSTKGYEINAQNWAELERYLDQQSLLLDKYEQERVQDNGVQ